MSPTAIRIVIPSRVQIGQAFDLKIRVIGEPTVVSASGGWRDQKPGLRTPFNLNVQRQIQFVDNTAAAWRGELRVDAADFEGPSRVVFDGQATGIYGGDRRPIQTISGCRFTEPGFHFVTLIDEESGLEAWSNPVMVTAAEPGWQIAWGDPHTHTFFTDGIRCPEDIYHFARHEGFLDFCALSDHSEGITDAQWLYFQAVTNAADDPGRFVTLIGQEWTNHLQENGAPGHRNIYVPGDSMPILRCTDDGCRTLDELWATLDTWQTPVLALPHHSANVMMGTDWDQPWNPKYETAVEIYSIWGNSERSEAAGNPRPIRACNGEMDGRHVQDALRCGRRMSFIGGGDTHDGRPGDAQHAHSYPKRDFTPYEQGFTAAIVPELSRAAVYDAIATGRTYATTASRIYLDITSDAGKLAVEAASEIPIATIELVLNGEDHLRQRYDQRTIDDSFDQPELGPGDSLYLRLTTQGGQMAWGSPLYG